VKAGSANVYPELFHASPDANVRASGSNNNLGDGLELLAARENNDFQNNPVVVHTSSSEDKDVQPANSLSELLHCKTVNLKLHRSSREMNLLGFAQFSTPFRRCFYASPVEEDSHRC
jgi:hypothetical protein